MACFSGAVSYSASSILPRLHDVGLMRGTTRNCKQGDTRGECTWTKQPAGDSNFRQCSAMKATARHDGTRWRQKPVQLMPSCFAQSMLEANWQTPRSGYSSWQKGRSHLCRPRRYFLLASGCPSLDQAVAFFDSHAS